MRYRKYASVALIVSIVVFSCVLFSNLSNIQIAGNAESVNPSYDLGSYQVDVVSNVSVQISSSGIPMTITPILYYYPGGTLTKEVVKSSKVNRIDNSIQNSVALIDVFSNSHVTFIYDLTNGSIGLNLVISNANVPTYIDFNISLGTPYSANAGGFSYHHYVNTKNEYGKYVFSNRAFEFDDTYTTAVSSTISWSQLQSQSYLDYGLLSISNGGDYLNLMTGGFTSEGSVQTNFPGIDFSISL